jgi:hypothetical protein
VLLKKIFQDLESGETRVEEVLCSQGFLDHLHMQKLCRRFVGWFGGDVFSYLDVSKREFTFKGIDDSLKRVGFSIDKVEIFDPLLPRFLSNLGVGSLIIIAAHL